MRRDLDALGRSMVANTSQRRCTQLSSGSTRSA